MKRSRVTLATIEAAAMAALRPSPPTTARCARAQPGTLKPSVMHTSGSGSSAHSTRPSAERFERCSPRRSIWAAGMTHTDTCAADSITAWKSSSRRAGVCRLESFEQAERGAAAAAQPVHVEADGGRDERPGERAPAGLVGAGHEAHAEVAVVRQQAAPGTGAAAAGGGDCHRPMVRGAADGVASDPDIASRKCNGRRSGSDPA